MLTTFIDTLKASFKERIDVKTGWGKGEVWVEFIEAIVDASVEVADGVELSTLEEVDDG